MTPTEHQGIAQALLRLAADTDDQTDRTFLRLAAHALDPTAPTPELEVVDCNGTPITVGTWVLSSADDFDVVRVEEIDGRWVGDDTRQYPAGSVEVVEPWPQVDQPEWFHAPGRMLWVNRDGLTIYDDEAAELQRARIERHMTTRPAR